MSHGGQVSHVEGMRRWREKQPPEWREEHNRKIREAYHRKKLMKENIEMPGLRYPCTPRRTQ